MYDFIKQNLSTIALSAIFMAIGFMLGCVIDADENGVYLSANYSNGKQVFMLGQNTTSIRGININDLDATDRSILVSQLEMLEADGFIGLKLREMVHNGRGPFSLVSVKLKLHLISDGSMAGPVARACSDSLVFQKPVIAINVIGSSEDNINSSEPLDIHPLLKESSNCNSAENSIIDIWVSKDHVMKWGALGEIENDIVVVKAQIIVSNLLT